MGYYDGFFDYNGDGETDFNEFIHGMETMKEIDEDDYEEDEEYEENIDEDEDDEEYEENIDEDEYYKEDEDYNEYEENTDEDEYYKEDEYDEEYEENIDEDELNDNNNLIQRENVLSKDERIKIAFLLERAKCDYLRYSPSDEEVEKSGFSNIREYKAAYNLLTCLQERTLSDYQVKEKNESLFILEHNKDIEAAKYLSANNGFLFCEAVKNNFDLPCSLPKEEEKREYSFYKIVEKISKYDSSLSFKIWKWSLKTFSPYSKYDEFLFKELCDEVIEYSSLFKNNFIDKCVQEFEKDEDFYSMVFKNCSEYNYPLAQILTKAIEKECYKTASNIFKDVLNMINGYWKNINRFIEDIILYASVNNDLIVMEYFKNNMFPVVKKIKIGMVQDEVKDWEKKIDDFILKIEMNNEKYAYSRRNSWRKEVPDGKKYGLDVLYYGSKEKYLYAYNKEKEIEEKTNLGKDIKMNGYLFNFDTRSEFLLKLTNYLDDRYIKKEDFERILNNISEKRKRKQNTYSREFEDSDKTVIVYGVVFRNSDNIYSYRGKEDYSVGEKVIVPVGDKKSTGEIVIKGEYKLGASPFPINKIKFIIGRKEND